MPGQVLPSHRAAHHDLRFAARALWQQQSWALLPVRRPPHSWLTAPASPPRPVTIIHHNRCLTACDSVMLGPLIAMLWMCDGHRGLTVCRQAPGSLSPGISGTRRNSEQVALKNFVRCPVLYLFVDRIRICPLPSIDRREFRTKPRVFHPPSFRRFQAKTHLGEGRRCLRCRVSGSHGVVVSRGGGHEMGRIRLGPGPDGIVPHPDASLANPFSGKHAMQTRAWADNRFEFCISSRRTACHASMRTHKTWRVAVEMTLDPRPCPG